MRLLEAYRRQQKQKQTKKKNEKRKRKEYDLALEYIPTLGSGTALISKVQQCLDQK